VDRDSAERSLAVRRTSMGRMRRPSVGRCPIRLRDCELVMQRYIVQTIYRVDIGHIVSYQYRQEKYRNFDISLSFLYRFNIGETTSMLSIYFLFVGNKSRTEHIMTLKHSLACRPNRNSTMLGLKLKYRPLYNSLN